MKRFFIAAIALGAALLSSCSGGGNSNQWENRNLLEIGDDIAIAQTKYGKVQGYIYKDIYTFLGVPYGAPTGGENRFMPPQEPASWEGIRPALFWGNQAPQFVDGWYKNEVGTFLDHWNYYDISEDCLNLNVWTPGLDGKKRPVMVWFHGGGYSSGNSIEHDEYHGENFAREEDVVFVSVNHRLNAFGFSDLSAFGEKYAASGNVGVLDLVASLKWVNENIAAFGGDPNNVTIMGQSGGGAKVCTVLAMESARGMVHKAVALSGNASRAMDQNNSREIGKYILKEAGLKESEVDKLQQMPWEEYHVLAHNAAAKYSEDHPELKSTGMRMGFAPVEDGTIIPVGGYFQKGGHAENIPVIFSVTTAERSLSMYEDIEDITKEEAVAYFAKNYPQYAEKAQALIDAAQKTFPSMKPIEWLDLLAWNMRPNQIASQDAKYAQGGDVYSAWFAYCPPVFDGKLRAFHTMDIAFWYQNTDMMYSHTGGGPEPRKLATQMGKTLRQFMLTGNPNSGDLPKWPKYTPEEGQLLWLDKTSKVLTAPDQAINDVLASK